jgi:transposase
LVAFFAKLPATVIGIEAGSGAHHWSRVLTGLGHTVQILPPQLVRPFVRRGKNDAADAAAICEAMVRPKIHHVPGKSVDQQAGQMLISMRDRLVRERTRLTNTIRGHAAEFGHVAAKGMAHVPPLLNRIAADTTLPPLVRELFAAHGEELVALQVRLSAIEKKMMSFHRENEVSRRLEHIPSVGTNGAVRFAVKVSDARAFRSGRDFAASLGLTPKDHSTGGRTRLGSITKAGDPMLRTTLVLGATAVVKQALLKPERAAPWLLELLKRKPRKVAAVALANKVARIIWKMLVSGEPFNPGRAFVRAA